jgi:demethylmenaquinone methyltransferase/2-methoxy-6-polyprenyl-1,4-benzoquinol methylase
VTTGGAGEEAGEVGEVPEVVVRARERAHTLGFEWSCEDDVGRLLAVLAAAVPTGGRVVELGTGAGVGLAWLVHGLGGRDDVDVVTVDLDADLQARVASDAWPASVRFVAGDGAEVVQRLGPADLVFADAPGGKLDGLRHTVEALGPGGLLVVDDMDAATHTDDGLAGTITDVRAELLAQPDLVVAELEYASGVMVATRRRAAAESSWSGRAARR